MRRDWKSEKRVDMQAWVCQSCNLSLPLLLSFSQNSNFAYYLIYASHPCRTWCRAGTMIRYLVYQEQVHSTTNATFVRVEQLSEILLSKRQKPLLSQLGLLDAIPVISHPRIHGGKHSYRSAKAKNNSQRGEYAIFPLLRWSTGWNPSRSLNSDDAPPKWNACCTITVNSEQNRSWKEKKRRLCTCRERYGLRKPSATMQTPII